MKKTKTFQVRVLSLLSLVSSFGALPCEAVEEKLFLRPPLWVDADDKSIPEPEERDVSELFDRLRNT